MCLCVTQTKIMTKIYFEIYPPTHTHKSTNKISSRLAGMLFPFLLLCYGRGREKEIEVNRKFVTTADELKAGKR